MRNLVYDSGMKGVSKMKKIMRCALIMLIGLQVIGFGIRNANHAAMNRNGNPEIVLMDFDNSGEPEWITR